jgi:hypothetical protein
MASTPILILTALVLVVMAVTVIRSDTPTAEPPAPPSPDVAAGDDEAEDQDAPVPERWTEEQIELMRRAARPELNEDRREPAHR